MSESVEKQIEGPKKQEAIKTKNKIKEFEEKLKIFHQDLKKQSFTSYHNGYENSIKNFEDLRGDLQSRKATLDEYHSYQKIFNFEEDLTIESYKTLDQVNGDLALFE